MFILKDPLTWWTVFVFAVGFLTGRSLDAIVSLVQILLGHEPGPEVELFTTTTPDAFDPGKIVGNYGQGSTGRRYAVTRLENLGSFSDIHGQRHQQWRVHGRPA